MAYSLLYTSYASNKGFNQELYDKVLASEKLFEEMKVHGNVKFDTDRDGLTDYEEIEIYGTNPVIAANPPLLTARSIPSGAAT